MLTWTLIDTIDLNLSEAKSSLIVEIQYIS